MDALFLTGMTLKEAKEILHKKGITQFKVAVTCPPRNKNIDYNEDFRVLLVNTHHFPITVLVCKP